MFRPHMLGKWIFPASIWHHSRTEKCIYLSFDDGPNSKVTPWVLKVLEINHAKATFFCLGINAVNQPDIIEEIKLKGHTLGNHGFNHLDGYKSSIRKYKENYTSATNVLSTNLFRPPYGKIKMSQYKSLIKSGAKIVFWDVMSYDFKTDLNISRALQKTIKKTKNGSVVVFHDSIYAFENLQILLPKYIEHFKQRGYEFRGL